MVKNNINIYYTKQFFINLAEKETVDNVTISILEEGTEEDEEDEDKTEELEEIYKVEEIFKVDEIHEAEETEDEVRFKIKKFISAEVSFIIWNYKQY